MSSHQDSSHIRNFCTILIASGACTRSAINVCVTNEIATRPGRGCGAGRLLDFARAGVARSGKHMACSVNVSDWRICGNYGKNYQQRCHPLFFN